MSDAVQLALIAGAVTALPAVGAFIISVLNRNSIKEVHTLTNSNYSKLSEQAVKANETIAQLAKAKKKR